MWSVSRYPKRVGLCCDLVQELTVASLLCNTEDVACSRMIPQGGPYRAAMKLSCKVLLVAFG